MATRDGVAGRGAWLGAPTKPQPARASSRAGNTKIKRRRIQTLRERPKSQPCLESPGSPACATRTATTRPRRRTLCRRRAKQGLRVTLTAMPGSHGRNDPPPGWLPAAAPRLPRTSAGPLPQLTDQPGGYRYTACAWPSPSAVNAPGPPVRRRSRRLGSTPMYCPDAATASSHTWRSARHRCPCEPAAAASCTDRKPITIRAPMCQSPMPGQRKQAAPVRKEGQVMTTAASMFPHHKSRWWYQKLSPRPDSLPSSLSGRTPPPHMSPIICANPGDALLGGRRADYLFGARPQEPKSPCSVSGYCTRAGCFEDWARYGVVIRACLRWCPRAHRGATSA